MPELANPWSFFASILNEQRSSKSPTVPLVQIRKVLPLIGSSAVVRPTMAPSLTDHSFGLPSHPLRSLPLKILFKPLSASAPAARTVCASNKALVTTFASNAFFINDQGSGGG